MKHKYFNRLLSMLLVATLFGILAVPATLDNSSTVTIQPASWIWQVPGNHQRQLHRRWLLEVHQ